MISPPEAVRARLAGVSGFLLDMDGTFYLGDRPLPGALGFLDACRRTGRAVVFVTNNSSRDAVHYSAKLRGMGADIAPDQVLTSGEAAGAYVLREKPGARVWVLGNPTLRAELAAMGVRVVEGDPRPGGADLVLAGYDTTLTFEKLCIACDLVRAGVPMIATHPDFNCPTETGYMPDLGSFLALIEASTGVKPSAVIGKPHPGLAHAASARMGIPCDRLAMVGDRLYTDIAMGVRAGMTAILVLTGEATLEDVAGCAEKPHLIVESLGALAEFL